MESKNWPHGQHGSVKVMAIACTFLAILVTSMTIALPSTLQATPETGIAPGTPVASSITSGTILIDGNADVLAHASSGSGTVEDETNNSFMPDPCQGLD